MRTYLQLIVLCAAATLAACSIKNENFTPLREECEVPGDEDGNGVADCGDPACASAVVCQPVCGNGKREMGEGCDDGNVVDGDGCDGNCMVTSCGNGIATEGEVCDDANTVSGDGCDNNCTVTACGNAVMTQGEGCDDGNLASGDGCDANCTATACGNGVMTAGEMCDDGNVASGDGCDSRKVLREYCSDGTTKVLHSGACTPDCSVDD